MSERKKVFDTQLYKDLPPGIIQYSIAEDLAGLVLEAGDKPLTERVNPRRFKIIEGKILDSKTGENIFENWQPGGELGEKEYNSATSFYRYLLENPPGSLVLNISPSEGISPYKEARINVGYRETDENIIFYGIPSKLTPEKCRQLALKAIKLSFVDFKIDSPDDLRDKAIPITVRQEKDPWLFLKYNLPLDSDAWNAIILGIPWKLKSEAIVLAGKAAFYMGPMIHHASSGRDYILAGAYGERYMEERGWKINHTGCSGATNTQLLSDGAYTNDVYGNTRAVDNSGEGKFVHRCGNCGAPIFAIISSGYICSSCRGVYRGC